MRFRTIRQSVNYSVASELATRPESQGVTPKLIRNLTVQAVAQ
jgi:hypothetical protein